MTKRTLTSLLLLALFSLFISVSANAQNPLWSGIIDPSRATDWSTVGVAGGIPARPTICTSLGSPGQASTFVQNVTASQISNAFASCPGGQTVFLNAGTYNIGGLHLGSSNKTLRGAGASKTILNVSGLAPVGCHIGDGHAVNLCAGGGNIGTDSAENTATWNCNDTGGVCAQNRNSIVLSGHTNLTVGHTIWLDQTDDPSDGYPGAGDFWVSNWGAGESFTRGDRGLLEGHIVTSCGTSTPGAACTSNAVTISPGLNTPVFRSARSPGAWWGNSSTILHDSGVENLTIDVTAGGVSGAFYLINCTNCWLKGSRLMYRNNVSSGQPRMLAVINGMNVSIVDNYLYGYFASSLVSIYTFAPFTMSNSVFQNNIVHAATNPFVQDSAVWNNVFSYNYTDSGGINSSFSQPSQILHGVAGMNLFEGNDQRNFSSDNIHSSHNFFTLFRNHFSGQAHNTSDTETQAAMALYAASRFFNLIGNVSGNSQWTGYTNGQNPPSHCSGCIFELGWQGTNSTGVATTGNDTNVRRTLMQWGNWDAITSTSDNGTNDSTGTRFVASEVPSAITNFRNPVPAGQILPPSFYLTGVPAWWATPYGTPSWPAIGPDVSGGNINNGSTEPTGGHANAIPSRLCFQNASLDPAYASSSPRIKAFDAATCYASGPVDSTNPSTPAGLSASAVSSTQINLSWTASTDNIAVTGYKIFRNGTQVGTSASTSYQDSGLTPSTSYSYTVAAFDAAGNNSGQSGSSPATTLVAAAPPVISNVVVSNISNTTATITWTTDIGADSQVEYGLTASYGGLTALNSSLITAHTQTLSGLSAGATYNFRVRSREVTGSLATSSNATFTTTAPPPGISLVFLKFDETGGTVAADSSGNGLNGTVIGGAPFVAGRVGNALSLNGSSQSVDIGNPPSLQLNGSMTISAWINSSSFPADDSAIVSGALIGFQLDTSVDTGPRTIGFKLSNSSGTMMGRYGASTLTPNTWYYVTGVYNAAAQTIDVYLNGNLDNGALAGTVTNTQQNSPLDVFVGKRSGDVGFEFNGAIDEVRIYGRAQTQVEIQADMNASGSTPLAPAITTQPSNQSVNAGQTATFSVVATGLPAPTYQWRKNGASIAGATSSSYTTPATVAGDSGSTFSVVVTNSVGSLTSNNATLTVNVAPTISTQPSSLTVNLGQTATFSVVATGTPAPTYQWRKGGVNISGATSASYTTPATVAGDNGAAFTVVVTNSAGTVTSNAATLTVNGPPTITTQPANQTVNVGQSATFAVVATSTPAPTYQWRKNGTSISGATSSSYTTPGAVSGDNGSTFSVVVTNAVGSTTSNSATLTVNGPPSITGQPTNATATVGQTATFNVVAAGSAPITYQWRKAGVNIGGATSASYTTPATVVSDSGSTFDVVVTNGSGSVISNTVTLTVNVPPAITTQPVSQTVNVAQTATFSIVATGTPSPTYQWRKGGANIAGATSASYTTPATVAADNGSTFTVVVTNAAGSVTSNTVTLSVNVAPTITTQPVNRTVTLGQTATFSVVATGAPAPTYQWRKGGVNISGATSPNYTTPATVAGDSGSTYNVVVTNAAGSVTSSTVTLTVNTPPSITTQPSNQTATAGQTATFSVVATGIPSPTYQWRKGGVNISGATSSSYTTPATVAADDGSTYSVVVTNASGSATSNVVTLTVNTVPSITTQPTNQSVTVGQTATFSVVATGKPTPAYQWRKGGVSIAGATAASYTTPVTQATDSGTIYDVVVTNSVGSATSSQATLTVNPVGAPIITTQPLSQTVVAGQTATFSVVVTGASPTYQWRRNGANISGATSSSYTTPATAVSDSGSTFDVVVTNSGGNTTSNTVALTVTVLPAITTQPASQAVVSGQPATFFVVASGSPAPTYQWRKNGTIIAGATASSYLTPPTTATDNGSTFDVVVTNSVGSVTSTSASLTVASQQGPTISITAPANGAVVLGVVPIVASAAATLGQTVADVTFTLQQTPTGPAFNLEGIQNASDPTQWQASWVTTSNPDGNYLLSAIATDTAGRSQPASAITVVVDNPDRTDPTRSASIPINGVDVTETTGSSSLVPETGSAVFQLDASQTDLSVDGTSGVAIIQLRSPNGTLISETGVPSSTGVMEGRIYAEVEGSVNTGIAISNPNTQDAIVSFYFTDSTGRDFGNGTFTLRGVPQPGATVITIKNQVSAFLNQAPFNLSGNLHGTFTFTSNVPIGVIALRGLVNEAGQFLMSTLPVAPLGNGMGNVTAVLPHFADGSGWTTQIILTNTSDNPETGSVQFLSGTGSPVPLTLNGVFNSTFNYLVPRHSSLRLVTAGGFEAVQAGSVRVVPDAGNNVPAAVSIFSFKNAALTTVTESSVPAQPLGSTYRLFLETFGTSGMPGGVDSGVAIANPSDNPVTVTFSLMDSKGSPLNITKSIIVPGRGQVARFTNEIFQGQLPSSFQGIANVTVSSQFSSLPTIALAALHERWNENRDFLITTTPPMDQDAPPATLVLFPQVVIGGGYTTDFILFGQSGMGNLWLYNQDGFVRPGTALTIPKK